MTGSDLHGVLEFLRSAERLENVTRTSWTSAGHAESVAEHTRRLCLMAKALDKLETIMQHNQGRNPPSFDYRFNLEYGARYTAADPVIAEIRSILDAETLARATAERDPA